MTPNKTTYRLVPGRVTAAPLSVAVPATAEPGVDTGGLRVVGGGRYVTVPLRVIVTAAQAKQLDLQVEMAQDNLSATTGGEYTLHLSNTGTNTSLAVEVTSTVRDVNGSVVRQWTRNTTVHTALSITRARDDTLPEGRYDLTVTAQYGNRTTQTSEAFTVTPDPPQHDRVPMLPIAAGLIVLFAVASLLVATRSGDRT